LIFYIAIALILAVTIYHGAVKRYADAEDGTVAFVVGLLVALVALPIIAGISTKETKQVNTWTQPLVQLDEYRYAGNIFIENDPTEVEYVYKDARGSLVLGEVPGHDSTIREVEKTFTKPTVTVTATDHFNHWVLPWNMYTTYHYDFKVAKGSVIQEVESIYDADEHGDD
jgi:Flp pilus assembly pilin Flp